MPPLDKRIEFRISAKSRKRWDIAAKLEEYADVSEWARTHLDTISDSTISKAQ